MFGNRIKGVFGMAMGLLLMACQDSVDPTLGRIYNEDGTFSLEADSAHHPLGMVFAVGVGPDSAYCYVVSLSERVLRFGNDDRLLPGDTSSRSLTGRLNTIVFRDSCPDSPIVGALDGYGKDWFVPSAGEWSLLGDSLAPLNERLRAVEGATILSERQYWCSTSHGESGYGHFGMAYDLYSRTVGQYAKRDTALFRPMLRVKMKASLWERLTGKQNI